MRMRLVFAVLLFVVLATWACMRDYVTGKRTFSLITESQEIAMGREADPQIIAEFGLYEDQKLTAYIDSLGQAIARISHRPNLKYTFRVLDSPIVNAFALPGGWVYFTRGILAHFNSEAELVGVIGHEVGHIVARHGAEQISKAQLAGLALGIGAAVSAEFRRFSKVAEVGLGLLFLKFSRNQEAESDRLGVEYATRLGYNAHRMADFFKTIARLSAKSGQRIPTFLSTHPNPVDREARIHQLTEEWQKRIPYKPKAESKIDYLRRIEGIVYGEDPRQGFVENNMFYHPDLRFQFPVPSGWSVTNSPGAVQMVNAQKTAAIQLTLSTAATPMKAADDFIAKAGGKVLEKRRIRVNGMVAVRVEMRLTSSENELQVLSHFIKKGKTVFVFHGFTAPEKFDRYLETFNGVARGFDRLRNPAALKKEPLRIRIRRVPKKMTLKSAFKRFGVKSEHHEELAILNGMRLTDELPRGEWIKIITD